MAHGMKCPASVRRQTIKRPGRAYTYLIPLVMGGFWLHLAAPLAMSVTQDYLDQECHKIDIKVLASDSWTASRPTRVIIAYTCSDLGQTVEYEALHFLCPHRGPKALAAAVYDVQSQTYLRDLEEGGNYRSVTKVEEIPTPSCDLPL
jgi:hypothetical protein